MQSSQSGSNNAAAGSFVAGQDGPWCSHPGPPNACFFQGMNASAGGQTPMSKQAHHCHNHATKKANSSQGGAPQGPPLQQQQCPSGWQFASQGNKKKGNKPFQKGTMQVAANLSIQSLQALLLWYIRNGNLPKWQPIWLNMECPFHSHRPGQAITLRPLHQRESPNGTFPLTYLPYPGWMESYNKHGYKCP
jgi:hypothetical protein